MFVARSSPYIASSQLSSTLQERFHIFRTTSVCLFFFLELKGIGLLSNKTLMHLEYRYRKPEGKQETEILNFKKKILFVVSLPKGLRIFPTSLETDAGICCTSIPRR
jgi:hypothetical protein